MLFCINCGEEVSEFQYNNFNKLCPPCVRIRQLNQLSRKDLNLDILKEQISKDLKEKDNYKFKKDIERELLEY